MPDPESSLADRVTVLEALADVSKLSDRITKLEMLADRVAKLEKLDERVADLEKVKGYIWTLGGVGLTGAAIVIFLFARLSSLKSGMEAFEKNWKDQVMDVAEDTAKTDAHNAVIKEIGHLKEATRFVLSTSHQDPNDVNGVLGSCPEGWDELAPIGFPLRTAQKQAEVPFRAGGLAFPSRDDWSYTHPLLCERREDIVK